MKTNTSRISSHTQCQRQAVRILFILWLWLLASGNLEGQPATASQDSLKDCLSKASDCDALGHRYKKIGNLLQAHEYFQHGLQYCHQILEKLQNLHQGKDHADVASALRTVGVAHERLGQYAVALIYYQRALEMQQKLHPRKCHADVASALRTVGVAHERLGRYAVALKYYQRALAMQQELHPRKCHADVASALRTMGVAHERLGEYIAALIYYQRALAMQQELHPGGNHADVAEAFFAVGLVNYYLGLLDAVIQNWEKALAVPAVSQATKTNTNHNLGCMYHVKALQVGLEGDELQAKVYLQNAVDRFQQALQTSSKIKASLYTTYGNFLLAIGQFSQYTHNCLYQAIASGDTESRLSYDLQEHLTVTPVLKEYIFQQKNVSLRAIDYAYYLMIHHYEDFQKVDIQMPHTKAAYLAAYQASLYQRIDQPGKAQEDKTAYYLLGSLQKAQGDREAAADAFARAQGDRNLPKAVDLSSYQVWPRYSVSPQPLQSLPPPPLGLGKKPSPLLEIAS